MAVRLNELLDGLGYHHSSFYREDMADADPSVAHLLRDAQRAHVQGSYFIRTTAGDANLSRVRPAVYVAEARTSDEAREIHRQLWNQGTTPFILVSLPGQVRVYTSFAFDESNEKVGQVERPLDSANLSLGEIAKRLDFLRAESIDSGEIWRTKGRHLVKDKRVDPKIGLAGPSQDVDWLRAVSVIWTSSITPYCLFLNLSAGWGISRSTIDLGDAQRMPMPNLTDELVAKLAKLHRSLAIEETNLSSRTDWQRRLDEEVSSILKIPAQVMLLAREFSEFRLPLVNGKAPRALVRPPDEKQLGTYARRLTTELDAFLERKSRRHRVTVLSTVSGIVATIELVNDGQATKPTVRIARLDEQKVVDDILSAAEQQYAQWIYVRRSVRVFAGKTIHICKPARRLEWTETQALLDAADIIAEVADTRRREV